MDLNKPKEPLVRAVEPVPVGGKEGNAAVAFAANGSRVAFGRNDRSVIVLEGENWSVMRAFPPVHERAIRKVVISPDGDKVFASDDYFVGLWDSEKGFEKRIRFRTAVFDLAISPDGKTLAAAGYGGIFLCDMKGYALKETLTSPKADESAFSHVTFSPSGRLLAAAAQGQDGNSYVRVFEIAK